MIAVYLILFAASIIYLWLKQVYSYWKRKNFPYIEPSIPFGNISQCSTGKVSIGKNLMDLHQQSKEPVVGIYLLYRPGLLVRDAKLAKTILATEFSSFRDRGLYHNPNDPVADNMLMLPGQEWKNLRAKLSPTFTSGRLKEMLPAIIHIADELEQKFVPLANKNEVVEIKDFVVRYSLDIVGTVAFGLDVNSLANPNDPFREIEKVVNNGEVINRIRLIGAFLCPKILEVLHMSSLSTEFKEFMVNIVKDTIEYREKHNASRKDFIQLLIELRNTGEISADDDWNVDTNNETPRTKTTNTTSKSLTIEQCAAQAALFYLAGFDTTASAISCCLFELSRNPDLLKQLQCEIDETMTKHNNVITCDCIQEMSFLDLCVRETVRKYPTLPLLNRICTKDYKIPDSDLTITEGTPIIISLLGVMRDPANFPEPNRFWPDRYSTENPKYNPDAYIPFGDGPRNCIGLRMGKLVTKIGLVTLLRKFNFECLDTSELEYENHSIVMIVKGGIRLRVSNRNA